MRLRFLSQILKTIEKKQHLVSHLDPRQRIFEASHRFLRFPLPFPVPPLASSLLFSLLTTATIMVYSSADQLSILNAQQSLNRLSFSPFLLSRLNGLYGIPDLLPPPPPPPATAR